MTNLPELNTNPENTGATFQLDTQLILNEAGDIVSEFFDKGAAGIFAALLKKMGIKRRSEQLSGQLAQLTSNGLTRAVAKLLQEHLSRLDIPYGEFSTDLRKKAKDSTISCVLNATFFNYPETFGGYKQFKLVFEEWLLGFDSVRGLTDREQVINHLLRSLDGYYAAGLWEEWAHNAEAYTKIDSHVVNNPFLQAEIQKHFASLEEAKTWQRYYGWFKQQLSAGMFAEPFNVQDIFVPLRAYRETEDENNPKEITRTAFWVHDALDEWLRACNGKDALRVLSGSPGSGKTTLAHKFALEIMENQHAFAKVLVIPLKNLYSLEGKAEDAITHYLKQLIDPYSDEKIFKDPSSILDDTAPLVLILDGLDELGYSDGGLTPLNKFIDGISNWANMRNAQKTRGCQRYVLFTGREPIVQTSLSQERKNVLHLLGLVVFDEQKRGIENKNDDLLKRDDRVMWWKKFHTLKNLTEKPFPSFIDEDENLRDISSQPLLLYLLSSYIIQEDIRDKNINLNTVYAYLLKSVHERNKRKNNAPSNILTFEDFEKIMQNTALCIWHGNSRTAKTEDIQEYCKRAKLDKKFEAFKEGNTAGTTKLLAAFYFRHADKNLSSFEFTHKSFGEYLVAKHLVERMKAFIDKKHKSQDDPDTTYEEKEILQAWLNIIGINPIDEWVMGFIQQEIALQTQSTEESRKYQDEMAVLIRYTILHGYPDPAEHRKILPFAQFKEYVRNAIESLFVLHSSYGIRSNKDDKDGIYRSEILKKEWLKSYVFENFILEIGKHINNSYVIYKNLNYIVFNYFNIYNYNLSGADLRGSDLSGANLSEADLSGANLSEADLNRAILSGANLSEADLNRADLSGAILSEADLSGAISRGADLSGADLSGADLIRVDLRGAILRGADLRGADLRGADLRGADLSGAILLEENLRRKNLLEVILERGVLRNAVLREIDFKAANLNEAKILKINRNFIKKSGARNIDTVIWIK